MILPLPGRSTRTHSQFLSDIPLANTSKYLCVESGSTNLAYYSNSTKITVCSDERFVYDLHKFIATSTCPSILRDVWEKEFDNGRDVKYAISILQTANIRSSLRCQAFKSWTEVARYYCLLAQSSFSYNFKRKKLVVEFNNPIPPPYQEIESWQSLNPNRTIHHSKTGLRNFPIQEADEDTIIYVHIPAQPGQYGYGYVWNKRKVDRVKRQMCELALLGYKVCISTTHHKWGKEVPFTKNLLSENIFTPRIYYELKAPSKYGFNNLNSEVFYCANF
jgi:hypothetical protein